jgi:hypothetical protein
VAVELGAVHAGELGLPADGHAAGAAHARAVHHDRVQAHLRGHLEGLRGGGHELHHDHRPDGDALVDRLALADLLERVGDQPLAAVGAVVRGDDDLVAGGADLVLEDQQALRPRADDGDHLVARLVEGLGLGPDHRVADAPAHAADRAALLDVGRLAQGAGEVQDLLALLQVAQVVGGLAHLLHDDGSDAVIRPRLGDGQGDALPRLRHPEDDELAGLGLGGHCRRVHLEVDGLRVRDEDPLLQDPVAQLAPREDWICGCRYKVISPAPAGDGGAPLYNRTSAI